MRSRTLLSFISARIRLAAAAPLFRRGRSREAMPCAGCLAASFLLMLASNVDASAGPPSTVADPALWEKPAPAGGSSVLKAWRQPASDDRGFDVLHYDLDLTIDPEARTVSGTVGIELRALPAATALEHIRLDLVNDLTTAGVRWNATEIPFTHEGDSLVAHLPVALPAGQTGRVEVTYQGRPPRHGVFSSGLMFREHDSGTPEDYGDDGPIVANVSQPYSAHSWWPCKDHPSDKATATAKLTVPVGLTAIGNGNLVATTGPVDGWQSFVWQESYPIAAYLVAVAVSDYTNWEEVCETRAGPVPLTFHVFPQHQALAESELAITCDMLNFLEGLFGPYPFLGEKYGQVEIKWAGAMENQTMTGLSQLLFLSETDYQNVYLHELAHHWFGDALTPARWADIWLNEGFARYCECLWLEEIQGRQAYVDYLHQLGPLRHEDLFAGEGTLADPVPVLPNLLIYDKGAWLLHMLRNYIGDEAFFAFLHDYATDPLLLHGNVVMSDMVGAASRAAGFDVTPVLDPWWATDKVPVLDWQVQIGALPGGNSRISVQMVQTQPLLFRLAFGVKIVTAHGTQVRTARLDRARDDFHWNVPGPVLGATIDIDDWLLYQRATRPVKPRLSSDPPLPNPITVAGTTLRYYLRNEGRLIITIYDVRGAQQGRWDLGARPASADDGETWFWDGCNAAGRPLPAGVYWLEMKSGSARSVQKLTLIR